MVALPNPPGRPPVGGNAGGEASSPLPGAAASADASGSPQAAPSPAAAAAPAAGAASAAPAVGAAAWRVIAAHAVEVLEQTGNDTIPTRVRAAELIRERSEKLVEPTDADLAMVIAGVLLELALEVQIAAVGVPDE